MLREDGWKEAAIRPTIEAVAKRSAVVGGKGSLRQGGSPKANQDAMAQMMELMNWLTAQNQVLTERLVALERNQAEGRLELSYRAFTPPLAAAVIAKLAARRNKFPHLELFNGD